MFDFGDEEEAPSAPPEPESGSTPSVAASAVGEPATSEAPEPETGETGAADAGSAVGEAAATAPAEAPEPEGTQTAAVPETGVEDYMEATAAFQIGDCTTALRHYEQAFDKGGLSRDALASAHNNRGRCLYSVGQFDEALADFDRAIGLDQDFAAAYYNRGRVHTAMGRSAEARADLKSAYDLGFGGPRQGRHPLAHEGDNGGYDLGTIEETVMVRAGNEDRPFGLGRPLEQLAAEADRHHPAPHYPICRAPASVREDTNSGTGPRRRSR
jgi:hypothetical protein